MKLNIYLLILVCIFSFTQKISAQINKVIQVTAKPVLYEKTDFDIQLISSWQNPYLENDVALNMKLTSPSGKQLTLPCYYEQGESGRTSDWKARFTPQEVGEYYYSFELSKNGQVVSTSASTIFKSAPSGKKGFLHARDNWTFKFDNGAAFRGVGENLCWESRANDDSKYFKALHELPKYNYEYMLRSLAQHGGNYFRTWISNFNLPLDWHRNFNSHRYQESDNYYNPSAIRKIDRMFDLADSLKLYVMLTLGPGNYNPREGGFSPTAADFFVNPNSKQQYKDRLRYLVARWGYHTSLGAWEFFNEVDNVQFRDPKKPINGDSIVVWHDEMSRYLKSIDPYKHLVTTSISHRDIKGLNSLEGIDFNQKHIYRATASIPNAITSYERLFGKPYVIGEYSYEWDWSKNFDDYAPQMDSDFKRGLWYGLFSPTPVLPLSWWWEYFDNRKTDAYISRVRKLSDMMLASGKADFKTVMINNPDSLLVSYGVQCGNQIYLYVYNASMQSRLANLKLDLPVSARRVRTYNCEADKFKTGNTQTILRRGRLKWSLAPQTDMVFIIESNGAALGRGSNKNLRQKITTE